VTPFCFEHVFATCSPAAVFAAYFDPIHQIEQDRAVAIVERTIVELDDRGDELRRVCRVVPHRQLPAVMRALATGPLCYVETVTWRRATDQIEIEIRPSLLRGRVEICGVYGVTRVGPNAIRRTYAGDVSVDVALLGARIERGIVAEFARSLPIAAACTQRWLDHHGERSMSARA
jgi:hypothetical protein